MAVEIHPGDAPPVGGSNRDRAGWDVLRDDGKVARVFVGTDGIAFARQIGMMPRDGSMAAIVSAVMERAGIEDSAHALRHTVATRLVRDHRHDLVLVADILGHADVKTTRHYARSGLEDRRAALEDLAD